MFDFLLIALCSLRQSNEIFYQNTLENVFHFSLHSFWAFCPIVDCLKWILHQLMHLDDNKIFESEFYHFYRVTARLLGSIDDRFISRAVWLFLIAIFWSCSGVTGSMQQFLFAYRKCSLSRHPTAVMPRIFTEQKTQSQLYQSLPTFGPITLAENKYLNLVLSYQVSKYNLILTCNYEKNSNEKHNRWH